MTRIMKCDPFLTQGHITSSLRYYRIITHNATHLLHWEYDPVYILWGYLATFTYLEGHPFLDLCTVLVGVEHENGVAENVDSISVGKHTPQFLPVAGLGE